MTQTLPPLEGTTLSGRALRFPQDLPASGVVLVIGFTHAARHDVGAWKSALRMAGVPFLSLPTSVRDTTPDAMLSVAQAMRNHVPTTAWEEVVQIHKGGEALLQRFSWVELEIAKVLRVGPDGCVTAQHEDGPFHPEALAAFLG